MKKYTPNSKRPLSCLSIPLFLLCLLVLPACNSVKRIAQTDATTNGKRIFKAFLFPYIPDAGGDNFVGLIRMLETKFEARHPDIDLRITMDANLNIYDPTTIKRMLGNGEDSYQVVELDAVLLNNLIDNELVLPINKEVFPDIYPSAWMAVDHDGEQYGMPTYLCSNIIYSYSSSIVDARNGDDLVNILRGIDPERRPLAGNFAGSWTLPSSYIDAYGDTYNNMASTLLRAYTLPLDPTTMKTFSTVVDACEGSDGKIPCLDGTYKDNTAAEQTFATNGANGFVGYSERLYYIRKFNSSMMPDLISAPLGGGNNPVMFVDALFFNKNCTDQCAEDALFFSRFMNEVETRNIIAFSLDVPVAQRIPRYLLQANQVFYTSEPASDSEVYQKLRDRVVVEALPIPSDDLLNRRIALNAALQSALKKHDYDLKNMNALQMRALSRFPERFD